MVVGVLVLPCMWAHEGLDERDGRCDGRRVGLVMRDRDWKLGHVEGGLAMVDLGMGSQVLLICRDHVFVIFCPRKSRMVNDSTKFSLKVKQ